MRNNYFNYKPILTFGFVFSFTTGCLTVSVFSESILSPIAS